MCSVFILNKIYIYIYIYIMIQWKNLVYKLEKVIKEKNFLGDPPHDNFNFYTLNKVYNKKY